MFTRIKASGIIQALFTILSLIYYTLAVNVITKTIPSIIEQSQSTPLTKLEMEISDTIIRMHTIFNGIEILSFLNLMFFIQALVSSIFIKKMGRDISIGNVQSFIDIALFVSSVILLLFIETNVRKNFARNPDQSDVDFNLQFIKYWDQNVDFRFQYLFSIQITCLVSRIALIIQFNAQIGPLIKIVQKMA